MCSTNMHTRSCARRASDRRRPLFFVWLPLPRAAFFDARFTTRLPDAGSPRARRPRRITLVLPLGLGTPASTAIEREMGHRSHFGQAADTPPPGALSRASVNQVDQFVVHRVRFAVAGADSLSRTMLEVVAHEFLSDRAQCLLHRRDLRHDVRAVAILLDHALQPPHLA